MIDLRPDTLLERASEASSREPRLTASAEEGFVVLATALHQRVEDPLGRRLLHDELSRVLRQAMLAPQAAATFRQSSPTCFEDLVIVTGMPRSGSTALHQLLAQDREVQTLPHWRTVWPFEAAPERALIERCNGQLTLMDRLSPELRLLHPMRAEWPDECIHLMELTMHSQRLQLLAAVPEYDEWLDRSDGILAYQHYRQLLEHLVGTAGRLVLKAPAHFPFLSACAHVFPEARFVVLRRELDRVATSFSALALAVNRLGSRMVEPHRLGPQWRKFWAESWGASELVPAFRQAFLVDAGDVFTVPERVLADLYAWLDWKRDESSIRHQSDWLVHTASQHRSPVALRPQDFGLGRISLR